MTDPRMTRIPSVTLAALTLVTLLTGCIGSVASPAPEPDPAWDDSVSVLLSAEGINATAVVSVATGWPYVRFPDGEAFASGFTHTTQLEPFRAGATYSIAEGDHLRIVYIPARTSTHALDEIIAIATDYPEAEVLLEAPVVGPQWPTLYIARLTSEEALEIAARLREPTLADADREGYPVDFVLTTIGSDGPVYTTGTLGDVSK